MKHETKSSIGGSSWPHSTYSEAKLLEARKNLERCLAAYDEQGEEGLQRELDQIYPGTKPSPAPQFNRVPFGTLGCALTVPGLKIPAVKVASSRRRVRSAK